MKIIVLIIVLCIVLLFVFTYNNNSGANSSTRNSIIDCDDDKAALSMFNAYDELFNKKNINYRDFMKTTDLRNPLLFFELKQLYKFKNKGDITFNDYDTVLKKLKANL